MRIKDICEYGNCIVILFDDNSVRCCNKKDNGELPTKDDLKLTNLSMIRKPGDEEIKKIMCLALPLPLSNGKLGIHYYLVCHLPGRCVDIYECSKSSWYRTLTIPCKFKRVWLFFPGVMGQCEDSSLCYFDYHKKTKLRGMYCFKNNMS